MYPLFSRIGNDFVSLFFRGGSRISGKGFIFIKMWVVRFADIISFSLNIL